MSESENIPSSDKATLEQWPVLFTAIQEAIRDSHPERGVRLLMEYYKKMFTASTDVAPSDKLLDRLAERHGGIVPQEAIEAAKSQKASALSAERRVTFALAQELALIMEHIDLEKADLFRDQAGYLEAELKHQGVQSDEHQHESTVRALGRELLDAVVHSTD